MKWLIMKVAYWGLFGPWTPGRVCFPAGPTFCAFGKMATHCGRSHGDQHKTTSLKPTDDKRVELLNLQCG